MATVVEGKDIEFSKEEAPMDDIGFDPENIDERGEIEEETKEEKTEE